MAPYTSPFFSNTTGYSGEQSLIDDLVREQIKIYGIDIHYMPRKHLNLDKLLHEGSEVAFEYALPVPMYLKSFSGYQNGLEMLTKFGVRNSDEVTLVMSRSEFVAHYSPFLESYYSEIEDDDDGKLDKNIGHTSARPKEGDLIYFPFDDGIFEIKYVMFDQPFFQLGKGYVFEIQCEKFEYSGEEFTTGIEEIDDSQIRPDYYRLEVTVQEGGTSSFEMFEKVRIYNLVATGAGNVDLSLYKDPGFLERVPYSEATVMEWNLPQNRLLLGHITNVDPDQMSKDTGDIDYSKFDNVLIVGQTTGATWTSTKAEIHDSAFTDNETIQDEFNDIKILDLGDENPFGFV